MINKKIFLIFGILILIFSLTAIFSEDGDSINLVEGKNILKLDSAKPFYAKTLFLLNPGLDAISYTKDNETIGYVNVFGGVGENFIIFENQEYEVIARENLSLILPYGSGGTE
jgi:hypothetical protein